MNLLLDTCALIWLTSEPAQLSGAASAAINDPAAVLHVSHASLWEIMLKHGAGKLALPDSPRKWWTDQVARWGLTELSLTAEALFRASELPPHHKVPLIASFLDKPKCSPFTWYRQTASSPRMVSRWFGEPAPDRTLIRSDPLAFPNRANNQAVPRSMVCVSHNFAHRALSRFDA